MKAWLQSYHPAAILPPLLRTAIGLREWLREHAPGVLMEYDARLIMRSW